VAQEEAQYRKLTSSINKRNKESASQNLNHLGLPQDSPSPSDDPLALDRRLPAADKD